MRVMDGSIVLSISPNILEIDSNIALMAICTNNNIFAQRVDILKYLTNLIQGPELMIVDVKDSTRWKIQCRYLLGMKGGKRVVVMNILIKFNFSIRKSSSM